LASYFASHDDAGIQIHQYFAGKIEVPTTDGSRRVVMLETRYPENGRVRLRIDQTDAEPWTLTLRIPAWSKTPIARINGEPASIDGRLVDLRRSWKPGDEVVLDLDLTP